MVVYHVEQNKLLSNHFQKAKYMYACKYNTPEHLGYPGTTRVPWHALYILIKSFYFVLYDKLSLNYTFLSIYKISLEYLVIIIVHRMSRCQQNYG